MSNKRIPEDLIDSKSRVRTRRATGRPRCGVHFGALVMVSALVPLIPSGIDAQVCAGNTNVGCLKSGSACSPVTTGAGQTGHCATPAGFPPGERSCECVGTPIPPPPLLDPRCSSRTATGTFTCTIDKPNVTQAETPYPIVVFAPGDVVEINADGCVQTGGSGQTWKRYVNPSGPNSDRLYHGLVRIPTGTKNSALVRIKDVISNPITVTGAGVPESQLTLSLGYEDDKYSDNGYDKHDNGTDNQCQTDPTRNVDGGPAHVTITISRSAPPPVPSSRFDFDVLWTQVDPNGLPYQPQWSWQLNPQNGGKTPHVPDTSICHNFSSRPTILGIPDGVLQPDFADCTDQADQTTVDLPSSFAGAPSFNKLICAGWGLISDKSSFSGHVNWFPVTLEGTALPVLHGWQDDDYTFEFINALPGAPLSINGADGLHVEFDSDETIDNFSSPEWKALHTAVDNGGDVAKLFRGHAILTGMFGLDGEHDLKSELHPLYALAILRDNFENTPSDQAWLMFVRNQGDEGFCSSHIWNAGFQDYTFRLPWLAGMTSVDVNWDATNFELTEGASGPVVSSLAPADATPANPAGVYVTFHLGPPVPRTSNIVGDPGATTPFIDGALHLIWKGPVVSPPRPVGGPVTVLRPPVATKGGVAAGNRLALQAVAAPAAPPDDDDEVEGAIATAVGKLTPAQQLQVKNARVMPITKPLATHQMQPVRSVKKLAQPPAVPQLGKPHAIDAGPATRKFQRDAAELNALCAASNNAPAGLPATVCTSK